MASGVHSWSQTAASNATSDSNVNWAEGQAPSSVNDSARAMMSSVAKWRDDTNGSIATGGTSTAYTVTSAQSFASLSAMDNAVIAFIPHTTSGAAPTLAVDGLAAKAIRIQTATDLPSGVLVAGTPYVVTYENGVGEFLLHNMGGLPWLVPLGVALPFFGTTAPNSSFVLPYGQAISRTTYSSLFTMFSTTYGTGDGSTTFNVPDLRGRVVAGKDDMGGSAASRLGNASYFGSSALALGGTGGTESHTLTSAQMPSHTHTDSGHSHQTSVTTAYLGSGLSSLGLGGVNAPITAIDIAGLTTGTTAVSLSNTGGGAGHLNVQPTIISNWLLRIL
jgi:microcystin-dependent protein